MRIFRSLRTLSLKNRQWKKYVLYSLGEILLIMIGLLGAYQINQWNEGRKEVQIANDIKAELLRALKEDRQLIQWNHQWHKQILKAQKEMIDYLGGNQGGQRPDTTTVSMTFKTSSFSARNASFESLKEGGINRLGNPELKNELIMLYDQDYWTYKDAHVAYLDYLRSIMEKFGPLYFTDWTWRTNIFNTEITNWEAFRKDRSLLFELKLLYAINDALVYNNYIILNRMEKAIALLEMNLQED